MLRDIAGLVVAAYLMLTGCARPPANPVEAIGAGKDVTAFTLQSVKGTRDGERLEVRVFYGDNAQALSVHLHFNVTPPARLVSGTWEGLGGNGQVQERSVTFLGGQSGPPSIGGRFDLVGPENRPLYRVTIPLQELKQPL